MKEDKGWWRVVVNNNDCPFRSAAGWLDLKGNGKSYIACKLLKGQFNDECLYENCKKRY